MRERAIQAMERVQKRNEGLDLEEIELDIVDVVEQVRQERYELRDG